MSSSSSPQDGQARAPAGDAEDWNAWFKEMRGWLMVVATVAASVTYQAGLNPPGGFWQDNLGGRGGHRAGNPVLRDSVAARYQAFYYLNSTSFVTSLVIIVLLMSKRFYETKAKVVALLLTTFADLAGLVGAYIAGSTRYMSSCIYVIVIAGVAFLCVIYAGHVMEDVIPDMKKIPCLDSGGLFGDYNRAKAKAGEAEGRQSV
ncbi:uncharacterized protein [Oryza sativa Japonica Group]|uniref:Embryogenesis transmembrane protein-like n=2 Tax=Oryza sativa subsp. japonica TaxID=39947 RepID=A0A0P0WVT2_ORYSJ|nr:embryogenesis transmembrane protein-like [Oryza sativa Japonica Group]BAS97275.1 Os06g0286023 [Oryza sativa Japonica Group]